MTEMSTQMDYINYIVIGIGINVQNEAFPEEIGEVATSLRIESGKKQNRAAIIEAVWEEFETYYDIYLKTEDMQGLVGEYNRKLANMNQQVRVLDPKDPYEGTARGITSKGELIVDTWEARFVRRGICAWTLWICVRRAYYVSGRSRALWCECV